MVSVEYTARHEPSGVVVLKSVSVESRYVSLAQASSMVALSCRTLRRAIDAHRLHAHRIGRLIRIDVAELRRWVEADGAAAVIGGGSDSASNCASHG